MFVLKVARSVQKNSVYGKYGFFSSN